MGQSPSCTTDAELLHASIQNAKALQPTSANRGTIDTSRARATVQQELPPAQQGLQVPWPASSRSSSPSQG